MCMTEGGGDDEVRVRSSESLGVALHTAPIMHSFPANWLNLVHRSKHTLVMNLHLFKDLKADITIYDNGGVNLL